MDTKIDQTTLEQAKDRYMKYESIAALAKEYNLPRTTLQNYVNKEWKAERELIRAELFEDVSRAKKVQFVKLTENAITILSRSLENLVKNKVDISMKEAKDVASIMESLDKITRLDENKPTEIHSQERVVTVLELREKLNVDPFFTMEDKDYKIKEHHELT